MTMPSGNWHLCSIALLPLDTVDTEHEGCYSFTRCVNVLVYRPFYDTLQFCDFGNGGLFLTVEIADIQVVDNAPAPHIFLAAVHAEALIQSHHQLDMLDDGFCPANRFLYAFDKDGAVTIRHHQLTEYFLRAFDFVHLIHGIIDIGKERALELYDKFAEQTLQLMIRKNHDYAEAWRGMRVTSYTGFILTKISRIKEIEGNEGKVCVSEGIDSNYMDIINYAVFGLIKTK